MVRMGQFGNYVDGVNTGGFCVQKYLQKSWFLDRWSCRLQKLAIVHKSDGSWTSETIPVAERIEVCRDALTRLRWEHTVMVRRSLSRREITCVGSEPNDYITRE